MANFDAVAKALKTTRDEYMEAGKRAVKDAIKQFMDDHPEVALLEWKAYIPGFNDGDPCTFTLSGPRVVLAESLEKRAQMEKDGGDFFEECGLENYQLNHRVPAVAKSLSSDFKSLSELFEANEELLDAAFGHDVQVVVDRDGNATVENYDCGF